MKKLRQEVREMSTEELEALSLEVSAELFSLKSELAVSKTLDKPHRLGMLRRKKALVLTTMKERERQV